MDEATLQQLVVNFQNGMYGGRWSDDQVRQAILAVDLRRPDWGWQVAYYLDNNPAVDPVAFPAVAVALVAAGAQGTALGRFERTPVEVLSERFGVERAAAAGVLEAAAAVGIEPFGVGFVQAAQAASPGGAGSATATVAASGATGAVVASNGPGRAISVVGLAALLAVGVLVFRGW